METLAQEAIRHVRYFRKMGHSPDSAIATAAHVYARKSDKSYAECIAEIEATLEHNKHPEFITGVI